ncbi:cation-translocating P-type ATPase [Hydrocarboniphaga sp.]|uniref:cation-translocating P-type ATPase n=1 Tax=Hydrocarboniphaga sp. TaxID=2033016 RepID=UPI003D0A7F77
MDAARADADLPDQQQGPDPAWYLLTVDECLARHGVDAGQGLSEASALDRRAAYGSNQIPEAGRLTVIGLLSRQFKEPMVVLLLIAAVLSGLIGEAVDTLAILVIVALNAGFGFAQSWQTDRAIDALKQYSTPLASVRRQGRVTRIPADQVVVGDIVEMEAGAVVPADLRLIDAARFVCDESILTGESFAVEKRLPPLAAEAPLPERSNMAYKGSLAVSGRATGLVVAIGTGTELGRIAELLLVEGDVRTALQRKLAALGRQITGVVIAVAVLMFVYGYVLGYELIPLLMSALSLAVAAIPEAMPAVLTMAFSLGAARMAKQHALVKHLPAVETLGSVTRICSDKTGTLTQNRMSVLETWSAVDRQRRHSLDLEQTMRRVMALNNDASLGVGDAPHTGDPTEIALAIAAAASGPGLRQIWPRVSELPFDSLRRRMLTVHRGGSGEYLALVKGAPESVLPLCRDINVAAFETQMAQMAERGGRILAFAQRSLKQLPSELGEVERDLEFIGLASLLDPPRVEAAKAVDDAARAGIQTLMVTGDHPSTAVAIARCVGISTEAGVLTGTQIGLLSEAELQQQLSSVRTFARVSPEQKIRIVKALRASGEVVAVTGDGVNDAPALKAADIGIAMGRGGTDVARQAADLVLLDDNFATIIPAVREGRRIYANIRKFLKYALTTNTAELLTLALSPVLGLPLPLLPVQILWINLVSDGLPGLALARDPVDDDVMKEAPRRSDETLFSSGLGAHIIWMGLFMSALLLAVHAWSNSRMDAHGPSLVFTALIFAEMAQVLSIRAGWRVATGLELLRNRILLVAVGVMLVSQMILIYWEPANRLFSTQPLSALELGIAVAVAAVVFGASEIEKLAVRRKWLYQRRTAG